LHSDEGGDSTLLLQDVVSDFEGAGVTGGDVIRLSGDTYAFAGNLGIDPKEGAALPGAGDGVTQLGYVQKNNNTFLIAEYAIRAGPGRNERVLRGRRDMMAFLTAAS
jgi:hypothetical protein